MDWESLLEGIFGSRLGAAYYGREHVLVSGGGGATRMPHDRRLNTNALGIEAHSHTIECT